MINRIFLCLIPVFILGCKNESIDKLTYEGKVNGYKKYRLWINNKPISDIYMDSSGKLIEFSGKNSNNTFKVAFESDGGIAYVKNNSNAKTEQLWIDPLSSDILFRVEQNGFRYESSLNNFKKPIISHEIIKIKNGTGYLSSQQTYDLKLMDTVDNGSFLDVKYLNKQDVFRKGTKIKLNFEVISRRNSNLLIQGDFMPDFGYRGKLDTITIGSLFSIDFKSLNDMDTLRFIVKNSDQDLENNIYYELPLKFR